MSLLEHFLRNGPNGFGYGSTAEQVTQGVDLRGKTILVTGCASGLGFETMRVLALRGGRIIGAARDLDRAASACRAVGPTCLPVACDLANPRSVHRAIETIRRDFPVLDVIVANAGIMALPKLETAAGYELQFFTNHIGHFLLVTRLLDGLTENGRVVILSSTAHQAAPACGIEFDNLSGARGYSPIRAYGQSKLANLLFAKELARRFGTGGRTANALHPGVISTPLMRHIRVPQWLLSGSMTVLTALALKTVPQGAATQSYLAAHPDAARYTGTYFSHCNPAKPRADADDPALARRLWDVSEEIVAAL